MKKNLRGKIHEFIGSEEGKVAVKASLTLGVATGSILLAQVIIVTNAEAGCLNDGHCYPTDWCKNGHCVPR